MAGSPSRPDKPGKPAIPEKQATPEKQDKRESPDKPEKLNKPDKPQNPDKPRMVKKIPVQDNRAILLKYAGLGGQLCVAVGLSVFAGLKADKWVKTSFPLFAWVLPLLVIVALIVKLIKDTSGNGGQH